MFHQNAFEAADRGVRVRALLDDNTLEGRDSPIAAIDAHPNIEIRIFNPFAHRGSRLFGFLTDLDRVNHRMHNKTLIIDGWAEDGPRRGSFAFAKAGQTLPAFKIGRWRITGYYHQFTPLQESFSIIFLALVDGKPRVLSFKELLEEFIRHRVSVIRRRTQHLLAKARQRKHTVEGLLLAYANIDEVIALIKGSPNRAAAGLGRPNINGKRQMVALESRAWIFSSANAFCSP